MGKLLIPVIIVILLAVVGFLYINTFEDSKPPISNEPLTTNTPEPSQTPGIVGGDKDAHGCIGSAGYSWCETKQKCLRIWEEPCENTTCALETCHGLDISCGPNPPGACTMMYAMGDKCLKYAKCGISNGKCQQIMNSQFTQCKVCVQACIDANKDDNIKMFNCESNCN
ncbi:MAG: hypothetical protein NT148_01375 [Candidatus Nealsonbacteria bacterium]|nr:hypothetical protein [Candidatus Nealsonbacteria bacterium]